MFVFNFVTATNSIEESVLRVLRGSPQQPLSALDVCRKLEGLPNKASVNRVLYHLLDEKKVAMVRGSGPTTQTPMWSAMATGPRPSSASAAADVPTSRPTSTSTNTQFRQGSGISRRKTSSTGMCSTTT